MTNKEKAGIILKALEECTCIDWDFEEQYVAAIANGLNEISRKEQSGGGCLCLNPPKN